MRPALIAQLGFGDRLGNVIGSALLARAAAIQTRRIEGPSRRMQDLAALSIGVMAILDTAVTRRAVTGLAVTLAGAPSPLGAIANSIAVATGEWPSHSAPFMPEPETLTEAPIDWVVFRLLQTVLVNPELEADQYQIRNRYLDEMLAVIGRDDGQPVGRLGISAYRWMRVVTSRPGPERANAALWLVGRASEESEHAMSDSFHWQNLHAGLAPVEPELLLVGLILIREVSPSVKRFQALIEPTGRPVINATLASAAGLLGREELAADLGGPSAEISGEAGDRWRQWLNSTGDGPLTW